jgi:DNA-binding beta-propeller fold protein YncE
MAPIDTATNTPGTPIPVGNRPFAVAVTPDGKTVYVVNSGTSGGGNSVTPITVATNTPGTPIPVGFQPEAIAVSPDGTVAYVANEGTNTVTPITVATNTPGSPITVGPEPDNVVFTPDSKTAYVPNGTGIGSSNFVTPITNNTKVRSASSSPLRIQASSQEGFTRNNGRRTE